VAIAGVAIRDLTIEPARLEEAFMEYYADDIDHHPDGQEGAAGLPLDPTGAAA
jgi:hypothetical protein